ncbi:hypothetical protein [Streptomyces sp. NPDC046161]|uniref:hypothetical protein n=1 Tax=Streptomyces sp. NPDC046161 TaxID=3155132 RepID=UPI0033D35B79
MAGRQVAEWTYERGRARHGCDLDGILERRWAAPGEIRRFLSQLAAGVRPQNLPDGMVMFLASKNRETDQQLTQFAACWRQLLAGRRHRILALTDAELVEHGRAFGEWFAARCAAAGLSQDETHRRLQHGSVLGVLKSPTEDEAGEDPEAIWFWAAQHCKTPAVVDRFRAGMLMAVSAQPLG